MLQKNQTITITIEDMSDTGEGIGHADGITVFVSGAVVGDTVSALILKPKKTYAFAKTAAVLNPSPDRVSPVCPVSARCGGCQLGSLSYEAQLKLKQKKVQDCISRIGGFTDVTVPPVLGMKEPRAYRNKGQFPVGLFSDRNTGKTTPVLGFYSGHSHRIVPTESCEMLFPGHEEILRAVREYIISEKVSIYNEETGKGLLRHVLMRKGKTTGETIVCLVINGTEIPKPEHLWENLKTLEGIVGLTLNVNREQTNVILGDRLIPLFGKASITDCIGDISFDISPMSFYQVNPDQTKVLYGLALDFAGLTGKENVWDLYCGIGSISLFLAQKAGRVYGIEIIPEAIENAKENAKRNHIENAEFYVGAAEEVFPRLTSADPSLTADVICVDPPRKGCDRVLLDTVLTMSPKRIVYVSCDPATLARDLKILCAGSYRIEKVQPVDMFPNTVHVETCVLLSNQDIDPITLDVPVSMEALDTDSVMEKVKLDMITEGIGPTYSDIQDYVLSTTGLHVSDLYISQIKRKNGIAVGEAYNKPKTENPKTPHCPPEKEQAIVDALKHFKVL